MRTRPGSSLLIGTLLWRYAAGFVSIVVFIGFFLHSYLSKSAWFGSLQLAAFGTFVALVIGKYIVEISETPSFLLTETQIIDWSALANELKSNMDPTSQFLSSRLADDTRLQLNSNNPNSVNWARLRRFLVRDLNQILLWRDMAKSAPFVSDALRQEIAAVSTQLGGIVPNLALNRWLLERAYPKTIERRSCPQTDALNETEPQLFVYAKCLVALRERGVQQRRVATVLGAVLAVILIASYPRGGFVESAGWLLLPLILLGPALYLREYLIRHIAFHS